MFELHVILVLYGLGILFAFFTIFSYNWKYRKRNSSLLEELFVALLMAISIPGFLLATSVISWFERE